MYAVYWGGRCNGEEDLNIISMHGFVGGGCGGEMCPLHHRVRRFCTETCKSPIS